MSSKKFLLIASNFSLVEFCLNKYLLLWIFLLHVVHDRAEGPGYYRHDKKDAMRPMEDVAERMLQKFIDDIGRENSHFESFKNLNTEIVTGLPVPKILEVAERINARMIVMGSQGLTGLAHLLIGSKAEQVVRISKIPVTIVKSS